MKKTYIKPENTVVMIHTESIIAQSIPEGESVNGEYVGAREVLIQDNIQAPDVWDNEW